MRRRQTLRIEAYRGSQKGGARSGHGKAIGLVEGGGTARGGGSQKRALSGRRSGGKGRGRRAAGAGGEGGDGEGGGGRARSERSKRGVGSRSGGSGSSSRSESGRAKQTDDVKEDPRLHPTRLASLTPRAIAAAIASRTCRVGPYRKYTALAMVVVFRRRGDLMIRLARPATHRQLFARRRRARRRPDGQRSRRRPAATARPFRRAATPCMSRACCAEARRRVTQRRAVLTWSSRVCVSGVQILI